MKCLKLIGQCEGSKSLRVTVRGLYSPTPQGRLTFCNNSVVCGYIKKVLTLLFIQNMKISCYGHDVRKQTHLGC